MDYGWDQKRQGLARARLGNAYEVPAAHNDGDALCLHRSERLEPVGPDDVQYEGWELGSLKTEVWLGRIVDIAQDYAMLIPVTLASRRSIGVCCRVFVVVIVVGFALRGFLSKLHVKLSFNLSISEVLYTPKL